MLTKVGHGILKTRFISAGPCALKKKKSKNHIGRGFHQATISETICQTQGKYEWNNKQTHADESGTRHFEKKIDPCVSTCLKKEPKNKSKSHWKRNSSSNNF